MFYLLASCVPPFVSNMSLKSSMLNVFSYNHIYNIEVVKGNISPTLCNSWNYMTRFLNSLMSYVKINHNSCKNIIYV